MPSSFASRPERFRLRLVFAGTPEFAERALAAVLAAGHDVALVLTQPDRPAGRGLRPAPSAVKRLALERTLELYQPESLRPPESLARIKAADPEAIVVAAYGLLLPPSVLDVAPYGAVNIHASLLPRWRGAAPIQRAILAGDRETGISIMRMDAGLDTGPLLAQERIRIEDDDDAGSLHAKLAALGSRMIVEALAELATGRARPLPQPATGAVYAPKIGKGETRIDWTRSDRELERAIRAFRPSPGASAELEGRPVKLWRAELNEGHGASGEILLAGSTGIVVACGTGALRITELQQAGGRRLSAALFLQGHAVLPGARFV